ncbi:MAG: FAD-binding protein [Primorskyibacter sp.]
MRPETEAELANCITSATGPLRVRGGGTRPIGHISAGASGGDVLDTTALSGVTLYEPGALTIVAQAGTPLSEIEAVLAAENQRLPFEPMDHRALLGTDGEPTIGGVVAGNVSGPRRVQAGACRDYLLGVRYVDGLGQVIKNGGRVMKNVTGYDMVKLMAGSWGTLGVLTEVSLKVLPCPDTAATIVVDGASDADAVAAMSAALGSPYEVTGAAHLPRGAQGAPMTALRIEGFEKSVAYRAEELSSLLKRFGPVRQMRDVAEVDAFWRRVRDVTDFQDVAGDVWRISVKPSDGPDVVARAQADGVVYDWGGGLVWVCVPAGTDLRARIGAFDGHATLIRASAETRAQIPTFQPEAPALAAISAGLRAKSDPRGVFNPGLMA